MEDNLNYTREVSPDGETIFTISLPPELVGPKLREAFENFRTKADIPGFRRGKIPMGLIKQRYGKAISAEIADELAQDYAKMVIEKEKVELGGKITLNLKEFSEEKGMTFSVTVPLKPQPVLTNYKGLKLVLNDAEVTETDIDEYIESLRVEHATLKSIDEPATADAILTLKVREIDPSGLTLIGRSEEQITYEFGEDRLGIGSDEQLIGVRAGNVYNIKVRQPQTGLVNAPADQQIVSPKEYYGHPVKPNEKHYQVEVQKVEVRQLPEVDESFVQLVDNKLKTVDDLRKQIKFKLLYFIGSDVQRKLEHNVIRRIVEDNPFPLSKSIVEDMMLVWAEENKIPKSEQSRWLEENYKDMEEEYRWYLLKQKIAEQENIVISEEEIAQEIQRIAEQTGETIENVRNRIELKDAKEKLSERLLTRRVLDFLIQNANIETRKLSVREYIKMMGESEK